MRSVKLFLGMLLLVAAFVPMQQPPAASQANSSYTATADGRLYAVDFTTVPGVAFQQLVDAGVGVAQSQLDSLGRSTAFASTPYPSESVVLLPGLVAGVTEGQTSGVIPEYPLIASSSHPLTPSQRVEAGNIVLTARSNATSSQGDSRDGVNQAIAEVSFDETTGTVLARSETSIGTLRVSDVLTLHGVRSFAEVRQGADSDVQRTSGFEVTALSVLGQRVAITPGGLSLPDEDVHPGLDEAAQPALAPLLDALAARGTTIETFPSVERDDGVTSAGLIVRNTAVPPPELASGVESVVTEIRFGGNSVSLENRAFPTGIGSLSSVESPGPGPVAPAGSLPSSATPPATAAPTIEEAVAVPAAPANPPASPTSLRLAAVDVSVATFYPVLFIAACVIVGIGNLFRHLAVRTP